MSPAAGGTRGGDCPLTFVQRGNLQGEVLKRATKQSNMLKNKPVRRLSFGCCLCVRGGTAQCPGTTPDSKHIWQLTPREMRPSLQARSAQGWAALVASSVTQGSTILALLG